MDSGNFIKFIISLPSTSRSSNVSAPFTFSDCNFEIISHLSHVSYMPLPSDPPYIHRPSIISCRTQIKKLLHIQISVPSSLLPLGSKYREHKLVKILQRQIQTMPSKTSTNHMSKLQYIVIYIVIQPSENLGNVKLRPKYVTAILSAYKATETAESWSH